MAVECLVRQVGLIALGICDQSEESQSTGHAWRGDSRGRRGRPESRCEMPPPRLSG